MLLGSLGNAGGPYKHAYRVIADWPWTGRKVLSKGRGVVGRRLQEVLTGCRSYLRGLHFNAHMVEDVAHGMCNDVHKVFVGAYPIFNGVLVDGGGLQFWKIITKSGLAQKLCFHLEVVRIVLFCL